MSDKVEVHNVNHPDYRGRVDAAKYNAMRTAIEIALKGAKPMTQNELREASKPHLPEYLFPGGKTAGWWAKTVQLDLEAKGIMGRHNTKPLKFYWA